MFENISTIEVWIGIGLLDAGTYSANLVFTAEGLGNGGNNNVKFIDSFYSEPNGDVGLNLTNTFTVPISITLE